MMNPLQEWTHKTCSHHLAHWVGLLTDKFGFASDQAGRFVPGLLGGVTELLRGGRLDLTSGLKASELLAKLDVQALAETAGVDFYTAKAGLIGLLPNMTEALLEEAGGLDGLSALVRGLDAQTLLGKMGGLLER